MSMYKQGFTVFFVVCAFCLLVSCSINPKPLSVSDRYKQATKVMGNLSTEKHQPPLRLNYYEVLAYSLKCNLDYRIKLANAAMQSGQLTLAEFMMFPSLNATGSWYTRNNDFSSYGITTTGQQTDVLNSTPRTLNTARLGLTWNILDFGVSYVKARQQGNSVLIAEEEARKQTQQLVQDVLVAYINVYYKQKMRHEINVLKREMNEIEGKLSTALRDPTV